MDYIDEILLFGGLLAESYLDIRYRKLPLWIIGAMSAAGASWIFIAGGKENFLAGGLGFLIGISAVFLSKITKEALGYGDSLTIAMIGIFIGAQRLLSVLLMALFMAGIISLFFITIMKKGRKYEIPFIPVLTAACVIERLLQ